MRHHIHRRRFFNFAAAVFLLAVVMPALGGDAFIDEATGITLPGKIGDFQRGAEQAYGDDPAQQGVAIPYDSADASVTFYIRKLPAGSTQTASDFVDATIATVRDMERQGQYSNVKVFDFTGAEDSPGWKRAAFMARIDGKPVVSFVYCKIIGAYLVKMRATTPNPKNDRLMECLKELQKITDHAKAG